MIRLNVAANAAADGGRLLGRHIKCAGHPIWRTDSGRSGYRHRFTTNPPDRHPSKQLQPILAGPVLQFQERVFASIDHTDVDEASRLP